MAGSPFEVRVPAPRLMLACTSSVPIFGPVYANVARPFASVIPAPLAVFAPVALKETLMPVTGLPFESVKVAINV